MSESIPFLSFEQIAEVFTQTKTATAIHVTEDAIIQVANDAMLKVWDKDKSVIGKSLEEALPELKGQPFIDMFKRVWNEGLVISGTDTPADLMIDGVLTTVYFDFEYRAIKDPQGKVICILHSATDVTDRYFRTAAVERAREKEEALEREQALNEELAASNEELAAINEEYIQTQDSLSELNNQLEDRVHRRTQALADSLEREQAINEELKASNDELQSANEELSRATRALDQKMLELEESELRFISLVEQAPIAIAVFRTTDLIIEIVNDRMLGIWAKPSSIKNKPLAVAMPELIGQPFIQILVDVLTTGEPYYGNESKGSIIRDGVLTDGYFNFICQPIRDENGAVSRVLQVVTDVTEQVSARIEAQKSGEMMRLAIDAARLGSWHINPDSKALKYNDMLAKIFGYEGEADMTFEQALGQVTDEYRSRIMEEIDKAIDDSGEYDFTYTHKRFNDGEVIWLRSLGKVSQDENGENAMFSGFVMDITELKRDDERKNDFIGMVSHELKTPLTSLNGYIQLLQKKAAKSHDTFSSGALDIAGKQVKKMTSMINGFLNISRLESGKITLNKTTFQLDELLQATVEEVLLLDPGHRVNFMVNHPVAVTADHDKISNVISNLLSNSIKYSPVNKDIEVRCEVIDGMAQISVKDQGMGIRKEDIPNLFERYYRVENNHTISGFGIGLYLSAEIIERHHGRIWAESEPGVGSEFYFSLPLG